MLSAIVPLFELAAASCAFPTTPFCANTNAIVIPASINNTTIVTTNATSVIPPCPFVFSNILFTPFSKVKIF